MQKDNFIQALNKAKSYGIGEYLEILGELSQESNKQGKISRKIKELITLGIALSKQCQRCINIHQTDAKKLGASSEELHLVQRIALFIAASPKDDNHGLWQAWLTSWREFCLSQGQIKHHHRDLIGLGIALIQQNHTRIDMHIKEILNFGGNVQEIFEVVPLALLMDGAPALSQIPHVVAAVEQYATVYDKVA